MKYRVHSPELFVQVRSISSVMISSKSPYRLSRGIDAERVNLPVGFSKSRGIVVDN